MNLIPPTQKVTRSLDDNMIPAINIVFLLLIFFMVAGQVKTQNKDINLPQSTTAAESQAGLLFVEIDQHGRYFFEDTRYADLSSLASSLRKVLQASSPQSLSLKVDKRLALSALDPFIDMATSLDVKHLNIETSAQ